MRAIDLQRAPAKSTAPPWAYSALLVLALAACGGGGGGGDAPPVNNPTNLVWGTGVWGRDRWNTSASPVRVPSDAGATVASTTPDLPVSASPSATDHLQEQTR